MSDESILMHLGAEIRRRRRASGWTLEELAQRARLATNFIGSIELGKRNPSTLTVAAIARGLCVPVRELFGGPEKLSAAGMEAGRLYDALEEPEQSLSMQLLRVLAKAKRAG